MNILTIPFRNLRRRPSKALLLFLVFTLGVMSIVALYQVSRVVGVSLEKKLIAYGANVIVSPATEKLSVSYGGFHMGDMLFDIQNLPEEETVAAIRGIHMNDRISVVAPKLVTMAKVQDVAVALVGVQWQQERALKSYWATSGSFPEIAGDSLEQAVSNEILLGSRVAAMLNLNNGDSVNILGSDFKVSGVLYETGTDDDTVLFMELGALQALLETPNATSFIEVAALCAGCPIEEIVDELRVALPDTEIKALQHVVDQRMASVHFVQNLALSISLVILITATAMVGLSMMSAVNERKKDIGILRSLGYGKSQIFTIFCLEAGLIGAMAGAVGYLGGFAASFKVLQLLAIAEGGTPVFSVSHLLLAITAFAMITVIAAIYPAAKGASVEPSTALVAL
ncbi:MULTISPECIES: ABC transporter permease [Desulfosediminicola]|uniref:ABC transporter permease n=1 Tax=Desulfosediminicola TaxID=2886823 RepID=UPI0010AD697E|nr:FtsX-like permease family protein [Desulfosediminicola ganghwensis]